MKKIITLCLLLVWCGTVGAEAGGPIFQGEKSNYKGFDKYSFEVEGEKAFILVPEKPRPENPWVWRATFPGYQESHLLELLKKGYYVAHLGGFLYGCPSNVAKWDAFYKLLTGKHKFSSQPVLEGISRGGLIVYKWASLNPDKVSCIVCLVPVCDIKSWPGFPNKGAESQGLLRAFGFTEKQALEYKGNPIDTLAPLAARKIPILHIVADTDVTVPYEANTKIMDERYKKLGGDLQVILRKGGHKISIGDPALVVKFVLEHTHSPKAK